MIAAPAAADATQFINRDGAPIVEPLTPEQFVKFQSLIYRRSGIRLDERKVTLLTGRVRKRLQSTGRQDAAAYLRWVTSPQGREELDRLLDAITTNETFFYRTEHHFEWFQDDFLPEKLHEHQRGQRTSKLRLWSAACSVGAEPYTMAFCVEARRLRQQGWDVSILGTDLSEESLQTARRGVFRQRLVDGMSDEMRKRFFKPPSGKPPTVALREEYRQLVDFQRHNLVDPMSGPAFDCIFLRNVLIYFDEASKRRVLNNLADSLKPAGYLVVGPSEGLYGIDHPLNKLSTFLYQKPRQAAGADPLG